MHLNSAKAGGVGALASGLARVPKIIFTAHGWAFNEDRPLWQKFVIKFFSWITVILSHKTIAISDAVKMILKLAVYKRENGSNKKWGYLARFLHTRRGARAELLAQTNTTLPSSAFIVGTIAGLHKNKGLPYAIEAFAKLVPENPNLYYFILGGGEEKERLNALVGLHVQGHVFY